MNADAEFIGGITIRLMLALGEFFYPVAEVHF
jgi:hypothetical protein